MAENEAPRISLLDVIRERYNKAGKVVRVATVALATVALAAAYRCGLSSRAAELVRVQISQTSRMLIVLSLNVKAVNAAEDARSAFLPPCDSLERGGAGHLGIRDHSYGYAEWHEDFIRQNPPETETGFISGACYTCAHSSRCAFACSLALDPGNSLL